MVHSTLHFDKITNYEEPVSIKKIMKKLTLSPIQLNMALHLMEVLEEFLKKITK